MDMEREMTRHPLFLCRACAAFTPTPACNYGYCAELKSAKLDPCVHADGSCQVKAREERKSETQRRMDEILFKGP
jgi:hypothetical protein